MLDRLPGLLWLLTALLAALFKWQALQADHALLALQARTAAERLHSERQAREQISRAAAAADAAVLQAQSQAQRALAQSGELRRELARVSTARPCLSADTRRLLHTSTAFASNHLPAPAASAAGSHTPTAADPEQQSAQQHSAPVSTEADVAGWILDAATLYTQCRARLDALRQWDAQTFTTPEPPHAPASAPR